MKQQSTATPIEAERALYWNTLISEWEKSELTKAQFCRLKKLTHSTFYGWYKKLRGQTTDTRATPCQKRGKLSSSASAGAAFIPINVKRSTSDPTEQVEHASFKITLPNGIYIELENAPKISLIDCVRALQEV